MANKSQWTSEHEFICIRPSVELETEIYRNNGAQGRKDEVMFLALHPWGWLGGCMHDHVVDDLCSNALSSGLFTTVARYNVRGNGLSTGWRNWSAKSDADDLVDLCTVLRKRFAGQGAEGSPAGPPLKLALVGYSFGSTVAAHALNKLNAVEGIQLVAYVGIGFPLGTLSAWFLGSHSAWNMLRTRPANVAQLLIGCGRDQFTSLSTFQQMVEDLRGAEFGTSARAANGLSSGSDRVGAESAGASASASGAGTSASAGSSVRGSAGASASASATDGNKQARSCWGGSVVVSRSSGARAAPPFDTIVYPRSDHFFLRGTDAMCWDVMGWLKQHVGVSDQSEASSS